MLKKLKIRFVKWLFKDTIHYVRPYNLYTTISNCHVEAGGQMHVHMPEYATKAEAAITVQL